MSARKSLSGVLLAGTFAALGCGGNSPGGAAEADVGSSQAALDTPGLTPVPMASEGGKIVSTFKGDAVALKFADALASCGRVDLSHSPLSESNTALFLAQHSTIDDDPYRDHVVQWMNKSWKKCLTSAEQTWVPFTNWTLARQKDTCNWDPSAGTWRGITLPKIEHPAIAMKTPSYPGVSADSRLYAIADLLTPSIDLCIAQRLRAESPGASGAEAILFSQAEQLELVVVGLERVQRSMLAFGLLGIAIGSDGPLIGPSTSTSAAGRRVPWLLAWARDPVNVPVIKRFGSDFAAAVQLHTILATELAELLARSGSAKSPRGGRAQSTADEIWGPGSWRQRAMASLFGTSPLRAEFDGSSPWDFPLPYGGFDWPERTKAPYARYDVRDPRVHVLRSLATALPEVRLQVRSNKDVDIEGSGREIYEAVETNLQMMACDASGPCGVNGNPDAGFENHRLWRDYGIRLEHAEGLARYYADLLEPFEWSNSTGASGQVNVDGPITVTANGSLVSFSPRSAMHPKTLVERAPVYTSTTPWRMPTMVYGDVEAGKQGFAGYVDTASISYQAMGFLGSTSALVAIRNALGTMERERTSGADKALPQAVQAFTTHAAKIREVINANVGERAFTLEPVVLRNSVQHVWNSQYPYWEASVIVPRSDSWWTSVADTRIYPIPNEPWAASLAQFPKSKVMGRGVRDVLTSVDWRLHGGLRDVSTAGEQAAGLRRLRAVVALPLDTVYPGLLHDRTSWTFVAVKGNVFHDTAEYRVLAANVNNPTANWPQRLDKGHYIGTGGRLGLIGEKLWAVRKDNPAQPAFDGFGIPTDWVPPSDATLVGGEPGESAIASYLGAALTAGQGATVAVQVAMEGLIAQQTDGAARAAAEKRAREVNWLEVASLCGENNTGCGTDLETVEVPVLEWNPAWAAEAPSVLDVCPSLALPDNTKFYVSDALFGYPRNFYDGIKAGFGAGDLNPKLEEQDYAAVAALKCQSLVMLATLTGNGSADGHAKVLVAKAVADKLDTEVQPSFSEFAGGSLQGALIEQWAAIKRTEALAGAFLKATDAAGQQVLAARAVANGAVANYRDVCNPHTDAMALAACFTTECGIPTGCSVKFNAQPLLDHNSKCSQLANAAGPAIATAEATKAEAISAMAQYATQFIDAAKTVQLSSAGMLQLIQQTKAAQANNNLDVELFSSTQTTSFGLYRSYHSYDLWRAKALVESARRQAVVARRSIEARFGVDLSMMRTAEPFVAAPSSWADEIFSYDLSLPAAVGLSVGTPEPGGIYPNKVTDYVANLERFVRGFVVARPSASAREDSEVLTLPGPFDKQIVTDTCDDGEQRSRMVPAEGTSNWRVYCPSSNDWRPVVKLELARDPECAEEGNEDGKLYQKATWPENPCVDESSPDAQMPTAARLMFTLDPWGRLNGNITDKPYEKRYNARWERSAVNVIGTGVLDCTRAANAPACHTPSFLQYNLSHVGPAWVTNYDQQWILLGVPLGSIEGAKGIATEMWLDPLTNAWSNAYVAAAQRFEFMDRPLGGMYELVLKLAPEVQLDRVEGVQLLLGTSYWVKQQ